MANRHGKSGTRAGSASDPRRRRLIRRMVVAWLILTLITAVFYASNKARTRRGQTAVVPQKPVG